MNKEERKKWLDDLKAGDSWTNASINYDYTNASVTTFKVLRRTATQIIVTANAGSYETRYRAKDGLQVGGGYRLIPLPSSKDHIQKVRSVIRRNRIAYKIEEIKWRTLPDETLEKVAAVLGIEVPA